MKSYRLTNLITGYESTVRVNGENSLQISYAASRLTIA